MMDGFNHAWRNYSSSTVHKSTHPTWYDTEYYDAAASRGLMVTDMVFDTYKELTKKVRDFALWAQFRTRCWSSGQERSWSCRHHEGVAGESPCPFLIKGRKRSDGTVQLRKAVLHHNHVRVLRPLPPGARDTSMSTRALTDIVMQSEVAKLKPLPKLTHKTINRLVKSQVGRKVSSMSASRIRRELRARWVDKTGVHHDGQTKSPHFQIAQARSDLLGHVPHRAIDIPANCARGEFSKRSGAVPWPDRPMTTLPRVLDADLVIIPSFEKHPQNRDDLTELSALAQNKELWTELTEAIVEVCPGVPGHGTPAFVRVCDKFPAFAD